MLASASVSSSSVLTPGRTAARSSSRVSPTSRPATRIRSICSGVLISIPRSRNATVLRRPSALGDDVESVEDAGGHLVDLADPVDLDQDAALAVDPDERLGLLGVDLLAPADDLFGVIGTAVGLRALQQALDELLGVDREHDHGI